MGDKLKSITDAAAAGPLPPTGHPLTHTQLQARAEDKAAAAAACEPDVRSDEPQTQTELKLLVQEMMRRAPACLLAAQPQVDELKACILIELRAAEEVREIILAELRGIKAFLSDRGAAGAASLIESEKRRTERKEMLQSFIESEKAARRGRQEAEGVTKIIGEMMPKTVEELGEVLKSVAGGGQKAAPSGQQREAEVLCKTVDDEMRQAILESLKLQLQAIVENEEGAPSGRQEAEDGTKAIGEVLKGITELKDMGLWSLTLMKAVVENTCPKVAPSGWPAASRMDAHGVKGGHAVSELQVIKNELQVIKDELGELKHMVHRLLAAAEEPSSGRA